MGRPPIGKEAMSAAERQRRHRAQLRDSEPVTKPAKPASGAAGAGSDAEVTRLQAEIAALKKELAQAKARIVELEGEGLDRRFGIRRGAPKPKAEKPPLPPDEERDRKIKSLTTRVRNLTAELHHTREWQAQQSKKTGTMPLQTRRAVNKALAADRKLLPEHEREADRDIAEKLFNAWTDDSGRAQRKAR